ncbi:hypothetical protein ANOM_011022 [Aspergillus nomiae NRRL 13137]|uniref:Translationally-controlled tumor protein homolog n=1 Tax=Aspergillus nomiae NRRL (strain ATCC 15546 / NRRL 13137 / CBS 260.88 / M93) TaxID=1509407 RepID=A0A0L1ILL4_ASPN3|nr:uncharacterized protein ANOM_011022 [Aspergillus nomiae NRRL 13137]KNG80486.1 hypothetical protein ANOM_011022 [Aspergillus nomiae NRRL 13137]
MSYFIDVISGDQLLSDDFPIKEVDDIVYEVDCKFIEVERAHDVDINANPSAEEEDDTIAKVNNVAHAFGLQRTSFDKKTYRDYISRYIRGIKTHLQETDPDRVEAFERGASQYAHKILSHFSSFDFYTGPSSHADGMVALLNYREDGDTPFFTFWKDGLQVADI